MVRITKCRKSICTNSALIGVLLLTGASDGAFAQTDETAPPALAVETRAAAVLDRAVEVFGGQEFLDGIDNVEILLDGERRSTGRSWNSSDQPRSYEATTHIAFQREDGNYRYGGQSADEGFSSNMMSAESDWANTVTNDSVHLLFPLLKMATSGFALPGIIEAAEARSPHLVIAELTANRDKLTWIGEETVDGRVHDLIAYPQGISGNTVFAFDKETGVLAGMQRVVTGAGRPDRVLRIRLGGYHDQDGVLVPTSRKVYNGDSVTQEAQFEIYDLDARLDPAVFEAPADFDVFVNESEFSTTPRELAPGVFWIANGVNSLFVEFDDYVVALNTPARQPAEHIAAIREQVGEKPIRMAVPMDHHPQHTGGLREYVAAGIPIATTDGNRDYFERLATVHSSINPDALARDPKQPIFEIVNDRRIFDDGNMRLELINIGPISHAEDIFVGYLPKQKILFSVDLLNFNPDSLPVAVPDKFLPLLRENMAALERAGIEAETVLLGHGSRVLTRADIEQAANRGPGDPHARR